MLILFTCCYNSHVAVIHILLLFAGCCYAHVALIHMLLLVIFCCYSRIAVMHMLLLFTNILTQRFQLFLFCTNIELCYTRPCTWCYTVWRVSTSLRQPSAVSISRQKVTASSLIRGGMCWYISFITAGMKYMYRLIL